MHKKKLLLVLFAVFIFSIGHTNNYKVVIDDKINEEINVEISKGDIKNPSNSIDKIITDKVYVYLNNENNLLYDKKVTKNGDITNVNLKYTYGIDEFKNAKYFNVCFENKTFIKKNNYLYIKGYDGFYCSSGTTSISIITNKLVLLHNADKVNGNTYTWNVNLKKYKDFILEFQVDLNKNSDSKQEKRNQIISPFKITIGIIIGITILILIIVIDKKKKEKI